MKNNIYWQALISLFLTLFGCTCACGQTGDNTRLLEFQNAPFPYEGKVADQDVPFFDVVDGERRGHTSARGGLYWEDTTYSDNRVLVSLAPNFNIAQAAVILVYFHGNQSQLQRDLVERQQLPAQLAQSGLNAVLVAPQFAVDALDSSAGHFADAGFFARFLDETAVQLAAWKKDKRYGSRLKNAPVVVIAYSGGYNAAAYALDRGGVSKRVRGLVLLDALYGQEKKFSGWIHAQRKQSFFFSAYTASAQAGNETLQGILTLENIPFKNGIPSHLTKNQVYFLSLGEEVTHQDFLSHAWVDQPLADLLRRMALAGQ